MVYSFYLRTQKYGEEFGIVTYVKTLNFKIIEIIYFKRNAYFFRLQCLHMVLFFPLSSNNQFKSKSSFKTNINIEDYKLPLIHRPTVVETCFLISALITWRTGYLLGGGAKFLPLQMLLVFMDHPLLPPPSLPRK